MRSVFALLVAAASFVATVRAVPTANAEATVIEGELSDGVVESSIAADEYLGTATLDKRQTIDLSGATCQSTCSGAPGTGPNQNDCNVIINQLLGEGATKFSVNPNQVIFLTFNSCRVNFVNTTPDVVVYQDNDWGSVASFLAGACNAAHGFGQGQCTFDEQPNAFIQVVHS